VVDVRATGLWHAELVKLLVDLRHGDSIVIADAGLPVSEDVQVIDLGWRRGEPRVRDLLHAVLCELVVERASLAKDIADEPLRVMFEVELADVPIDWISHDELKVLACSARAVIRTGDDTPFANVVLHAGVPFAGTDRRGVAS
jgi:D-ribose pyranase